MARTAHSSDQHEGTVLGTGRWRMGQGLAGSLVTKAVSVEMWIPAQAACGKCCVAPDSGWGGISSLLPGLPDSGHALPNPSPSVWP